MSSTSTRSIAGPADEVEVINAPSQKGTTDPATLKRPLTEAEQREAYDRVAYSASKFGELGTYMKHKRMKL